MPITSAMDCHAATLASALSTTRGSHRHSVISSTLDLYFVVRGSLKGSVLNFERVCSKFLRLLPHQLCHVSDV